MSKVYKYVQETIIRRLEEAMEKGEMLPWQKPWNGKGYVNYVTRKSYRGINLLLLPEPGEYITFNQIQKIRKKNPGIKLKKESKANMVVFWAFNKRSKKKKTDEETGEEVIVNILEKYNAPIFRYYKVFNIDDVEGLETKFKMDFEHKGIEKADKLIEKYGKEKDIEISIKFGTDKAYYNTVGDFISVPDKKQYYNIAEYYSTTFHEMIHSTGHPERLKRFKEGDAHIFGSESYSQEELVAEIGANMLMGKLGIDNEEAQNNSIAYLQSWLNAIKNDVKFITIAAQRAQKAADFILGEEFESLAN